MPRVSTTAVCLCVLAAVATAQQSALQPAKNTRTGLVLHVSRFLCWSSGHPSCGGSSPTPNPTASTATPNPTPYPSKSPTPSPTDTPTPDPTLAPTDVPTAAPTAGPTVEAGSPTNAPTTASPTLEPTQGPTAEPSIAPTEGPTTAAPTSAPVQPTAAPTLQPTAATTVMAESAITLTGYTTSTFDDEQKLAFRKAVQSALGLGSTDDVEITSVTASSRRLSSTDEERRRLNSGVVVDYRVKLASTADANAVSTSMKAIGEDDSPVAQNFIDTLVHFSDGGASGVQVQAVAEPVVREGTEVKQTTSTTMYEVEWVSISDSKVDAHGWCMYLGWGILIPAGIVIARFGKAKPGGWWFKTHRASQTAGLVFALIGMFIGIASVDGHNGKHFQSIKGMDGIAAKHYPLALVTMLLGVLQPVNALLRPHAPATKAERTATRLAWEVYHKGSGYLAVVLAWATIYSGMELHETSASKSAHAKELHIAICCLWVTIFLFFTFTQDGSNVSNDKEPANPSRPSGVAPAAKEGVSMVISKPKMDV